MRRTIALLTAAGMMMPLAAHALNERVWLSLNGGGGTYDMSTLNAELDDINASYGYSFPHVTQGTSMGGSVGFETAGRWNYGLGFDRLAATTRTSDASGSIEYALGANAWRMFAEYALRPIGRSTVFVGAGFGILQEHGKIVFTAPGTAPDEYKTNGSNPMIEGYVGGNVWATSRFG